MNSRGAPSLMLLRLTPGRWVGGEQSNDSGLASYVAGQIDKSLSWKVGGMGGQRGDGKGLDMFKTNRK